MAQVAVIGAGQTPFLRRRDGSTWRDWCRTAADTALAMAGVDLRDIDTLVLGSETDLFTLQLNPATLLASDLGLVAAAALRVEGGGASGALAVQAGAARVLAGLSRHVLVVGVDAAASGQVPEVTRALYARSFDALIEGAAGITATQLYVLSWQLFAAEQGLGEADLAAVTIAHRANAMANPDAHLPRPHTVDEIAASQLIASPYRRLHCSPLSDGAAAVVLSATARRGAPVIVGMGAATDRAQLGARDRPGHFAAKTAAMQQACAMAGVGPADIGLLELYDPYAGAALQGLHALGLSSSVGRDLASGRFGAGGAVPVNLSGGLLGQGVAPGATGVAQVGACALMLEGRYHAGAQPASPPRHALADTHGGLCTTAAVTILRAAA